jgi:hypothetical protein
MTLTREQILAKRSTLARESVEVPDLDGSVLIRVLTLKEVGEIQKAQKAEPDPLKLYPRLVSLACVNEDGSPLFVGEDVALVGDLPWPAVDLIARAVLRVSKMTEDEAPKASAPTNGSAVA